MESVKKTKTKTRIKLVKMLDRIAPLTFGKLVTPYDLFHVKGDQCERYPELKEEGYNLQKEFNIDGKYRCSAFVKAGVLKEVIINKKKFVTIRDTSNYIRDSYINSLIDIVTEEKNKKPKKPRKAKVIPNAEEPVLIPEDIQSEPQILNDPDANFIFNGGVNFKEIPSQNNNPNEKHIEEDYHILLIQLLEESNKQQRLNYNATLENNKLQKQIIEKLNDITGNGQIQTQRLCQIKDNTSEFNDNFEKMLSLSTIETNN